MNITDRMYFSLTCSIVCLCPDARSSSCLVLPPHPHSPISTCSFFNASLKESTYPDIKLIFRPRKVWSCVECWQSFGWRWSGAPFCTNGRMQRLDPVGWLIMSVCSRISASAQANGYGNESRWQITSCSSVYRSALPPRTDINNDIKNTLLPRQTGDSRQTGQKGNKWSAMCLPLYVRILYMYYIYIYV